MSVSLILSHDNMRNTTFDCDSLGIHYRVVSEKHLLVTGHTTQISRWDRDSNQFILIAEWERRNLHSDIFRFPTQTGELANEVTVKDFFTRKYSLTKTENSFIGNDGRRYTWKETSHLEVYATDGEGEKVPIARFHRGRIIFGSRKASLELFPGYERTLDALVLSLLYIEYKRREAETTAAAAAGSAANA